MWTLYNLKLGSFHHLTDEEAKEAIDFYHMFKNHLGVYQNARCDLYMWIKEKEIINGK